MNNLVSIHQPDAVAEVARRLRLDPQALRQLRNAFYKRGEEPLAALALLPEPARAAFAEKVQFSSLDLALRQDSTLDGATKLAFRTSDGGHLVESVILRIRSGRTSLCVSTQIGCAAACRFCATGTRGLTRDLTADEILDQVAQASQLLRREKLALRNVVFMGMGEPFHNETNLRAALDRLLAPDGFNLSARKILVSTIGVPDAMERFAVRYPQVGLAVSLHSARPAVRQNLMPLTARHPLPRLREAMERVCATTGGPIMIEQLLLRDINDGAEEIAALTAYLAGLPVHLNLIPLNGTLENAHLTGSPTETVQAFAQALRAAGFTVTLRHSLGADIAAACGQLATGGHSAPGADGSQKK